MKNIFLSAMLFFAILPGLSAQDFSDKPPKDVGTEKRAENITTALSEQINMTEEQHSAIHLTWTEFYTDMQELRKNKQVNRSSARKAMLKLEQERDLKIKGILDEEQYTQYEEFLKEMKSSRSNRIRQRN